MLAVVDTVYSPTNLFFFSGHRVDFLRKWLSVLEEDIFCPFSKFSLAGDSLRSTEQGDDGQLRIGQALHNKMTALKVGTKCL